MKRSNVFVCLSLMLNTLRYWRFSNWMIQHRCFPVNITRFLRAPFLTNICQQLLMNDGNSLFWSKSWKPPLIAQYDAQPRRIKKLIVLLFLNISTSLNVQGRGGDFHGGQFSWGQISGGGVIFAGGSFFHRGD